MKYRPLLLILLAALLTLLLGTIAADGQTVDCSADALTQTMVDDCTILPDASYTLSVEVTLDDDAKRLVGAGRTETVIYPQNSTARITVATFDAYLADFTVDGRDGGDTAIWIEKGRSSILERILVTGMADHGIVIDAGTAQPPNDTNNIMLFTSVESRLNGGDGIHIAETGETVNYNGNTFENIRVISNDGDGLQLRGVGNVVKGGHFAENDGYGIALGEDTDDELTVDSLLVWPWVEGNITGSVIASTEGVGTLYLRRSGATAAAERPGRIVEIFAGRRTADGEFDVVTGDGETLEFRGNQQRLLPNGTSTDDSWFWADGNNGTVFMGDDLVSKGFTRLDGQLRLNANVTNGRLEVFNASGVSLGFITLENE